ncbi:hypothetical protein ACV1MM_30530 [Pseudomonas aeruginosa]
MLILDQLDFCAVLLEQGFVPGHAGLQRGLDPRFCPFAFDEQESQDTDGDEKGADHKQQNAGDPIRVDIQRR